MCPAAGVLGRGELDGTQRMLPDHAAREPLDDVGIGVLAEAREPAVEFLAGEVPGKRFGDLVVEPLEPGEAFLDFVEVVEVVGGGTLRWKIEK